MRYRALVAALILVVLVCEATRAQDSAPAAVPTAARRPTLAVVGFDSAPGGDPRDAWLPVAVEETLTWRLRRVPALSVLPTIRVYQGRMELQGGAADAPQLNVVARELGATHVLSGRCSGMVTSMTIELSLTPVASSGGQAVTTVIADCRLFDALDRATRWVLEQFGATSLEESVARRVFAAPSRTPTAVEYYAKAIDAMRRHDVRDALRYAEDAVGSDDQYRPALGLLAQLESQMGAAQRRSATVRLRTLSVLARRDEDRLGHASAELSLSLLDQAAGASEAALTRAQNALSLAVEAQDVFGEIAALSWLCDLYISWRPAPGTSPSADSQQKAIRDNLQRAAEWQVRLLNRLEEIGDRIGGLPAASKLALIYERMEQPDRALEMHQYTLRLAQALRSQRHEATAWLYLSQWYQRQQRFPEALEAGEQCLVRVDKASAPAVRIVLGSVYEAMQSPEKALEQFRLAYEQLQQTDDLASQYTCLRSAARAHHELGQRTEALAVLREAIDVAHALGLPELEGLKAEYERWSQTMP